MCSHLPLFLHYFTRFYFHKSDDPTKLMVILRCLIPNLKLGSKSTVSILSSLVTLGAQCIPSLQLSPLFYLLTQRWLLTALVVGKSLPSQISYHLPPVLSQRSFIYFANGLHLVADVFKRDGLQSITQAEVWQMLKAGR